MAWIQVMPGVYAGVPDEVQLKVAVKAEAETAGEQCPSHLVGPVDQSPGDTPTPAPAAAPLGAGVGVSPMDWWEFEALEHDASELA